MNRRSRITVNTAICHGQPTIRGLRYPVETLLELLHSGMSVEEILSDFRTWSVRICWPCWGSQTGSERPPRTINPRIEAEISSAAFVEWTSYNRVLRTEVLVRDLERRMTLTLTLPDEVNRRLVRAAEESGLAVEAVAVNIIAGHLTPERKAAQAVALLQSWLDDPDPADQKATGDFLVKVLDEDRPSDRKLFPPELEGVSW